MNLEAFVTYLERLAMNLEAFVTYLGRLTMNLEAFVTNPERLAMNLEAFVTYLGRLAVKDGPSESPGLRYGAAWQTPLPSLSVILRS
jgi:hypothetical protein